jgi:aspartate aminotransferase-like enzyme
MPMPSFSPLLNPPVYPAERYAPLADRLKRLLACSSDVVFIQAEAIVALEAATSSLARPGMTAVNVVSSPYGTYFGGWLRRGGANVQDIVAEPGRPIAVEAIGAAFERLPTIDLVAVVHAESANGALNPLADIAALAKTRNALLVVDAVASFGGHPLHVDPLDIDVAIVGPQKALGGSSGVSVAAVSQRAWAHMARTPKRAPSTLALLDLKENWLDRGRGALLGMPSSLEFWALEAALDRVEAEGLSRLIARHQRAAAASRAGLRALGVGPWIADDRSASALVTAAPVPDGIRAAALIAEAASLGVALGPGFGDISERLVRLDHTGTKASFGNVLANVVAYGSAVARLGASANIGAASEAVVGAYAVA